MSKLYISGEKTIEGPWILNSKSFEELSEVLDSINKSIENSANAELKELAQKSVQKGLFKNIEDALNDKKEYYEDSIVYEITLISNDNKKLVDNSLKKLLRDVKLTDFSPISIDVEIEYKRTNRFKLTLKKSTEKLYYFIECYDHSIKEEIKYELERWINKYRPNIFVKYWNQFGGLLAFLFGFIGFIAYINIEDVKYVNSKLSYTNAISQLLKQGVNKENETKAIELLLKYTTDYQPVKIISIKTYDKQAVVILIISVIIFFTMIIKPKTTLGIGKLEKLSKVYVSYTKLMLITLPSMIIIPVIVDWIIKLIN